MRIYKITKSNIVSSYSLASDVETYHHTHDDIVEGDLLERIHRYKFWELVTYDIDKLNLDEWDLYDDLVDKYIDEIRVNSDYPPVIIDDKSYGIPTIVDGTHRLNALDKLGYKKIKAYVPYIQ